MEDTRPPPPDGPSSCAFEATDSKDKERDSVSAPAYRGVPDTEKNDTLSLNDIDNDIYNRFSVGRKRAIVAVVSFAALLARG